MISASRHSKFIVASDFLELNRDKMVQWLAGGSIIKDVQQDQTWLPFSRYVARLERLEYDAPSYTMIESLNNTILKSFSFLCMLLYK
jgi:hypothetical protein